MSHHHHWENADRRIPESLPVERMAEGFPTGRHWDPFPSPLLSLTPWCQVLSDEHAREMCLRFADMECKLGEIDRARAIYSFCSQICDPRVRVVPSVGEVRVGSGDAVPSTWLNHMPAPHHRQLGHSGKHGRTLRFGTAMRIPSGRC